MDILNSTQKDAISKPQIEAVEQEKQEYKLIGNFMRRKGLKLFSYNVMRDELVEVGIRFADTVHLETDENGHLTTKSYGEGEVVLDSRDEYFESLNVKNAENRVKKFKEGKLKKLCNLREVNNQGIDIFKPL